MIGVGTAGCRIASNIKNSLTIVNRTFFISADESDVKNLPSEDYLLIPVQPSFRTVPSAIRAGLLRSNSAIEEHLSDAKIVFVIGSLGGVTGSSIMPMLAEVAYGKKISAVSFALMPFRFEKGRHFRAGASLRRLHRCPNRVVVIDLDSILSKARDYPLIEAYDLVDRMISLSIEKLLSASDEEHYPVGLGNLVSTVSKGYSVLSLGRSSSLEGVEEAVVEAIQSLYRMVSPKEASEALLHIVGDKAPTPRDLEVSSRRLTDLIGEELPQIHHGFSLSSGSQTAAIIVASGFKHTKFDEYDPLGELFDAQQPGTAQLDEEPETAVEIELPLYSLDT